MKRNGGDERNVKNEKIKAKRNNILKCSSYISRGFIIHQFHIVSVGSRNMVQYLRALGPRLYSQHLYDSSQKCTNAGDPVFSPAPVGVTYKYGSHKHTQANIHIYFKYFEMRREQLLKILFSVYHSAETTVSKFPIFLRHAPLPFGY